MQSFVQADAGSWSIPILMIEAIAFVLAVRWARSLPRDEDAPAWWAWLLAALPAAVVGSYVLAGWSAAGIVDGDAIGNAWHDSQSLLAYLMADKGMPGRTHAIVRVVTGTSASVPDAWSLGRVLFVIWTLGMARLALRWLPWWAVAPGLAAFVGFADPLIAFFSARAYPVFLTTSVWALAVSKARPPWGVALLVLACLDNPLCLVLLPAVLDVRGWPSREQVWVGAAVVGAVAPSLVEALLFHGGGVPGGQYWAETGLRLAMLGVLLVPARTAGLRWQQGWMIVAVAIVVLAMGLEVVPVGRRVVAFVVPLGLVVGAAALGDRLHVTVPAAIGLLLVGLLWEPRMREAWIGPAQKAESARLVRDALGERRREGEPVVVVPSQAFEELLSASGLADPRLLRHPTMPIDGIRPGRSSMGGLGPCEDGAAKSWVILFVPDMDDHPDDPWAAACGSCELVWEISPWALASCVAAPEAG